MGRACSAYGEMSGAYWILVEYPEGRRLIRKTQACMGGYIKKDLQGMGWGGGTDIGFIELRIETDGDLLSMQ